MKNKTEDNVVLGAGCFVLILWFISVVLSLGLTGVIIWAIIELVQHLIK